MKVMVIVFCLGVIALSVAQAQPPDIADLLPRPVDNIIPDAATAVNVAVAIFEARYGSRIVAMGRPYEAELTGEVWRILSGASPHLTRGGGHPEMVISRRDGRVIRMSLSR